MVSKYIIGRRLSDIASFGPRGWMGELLCVYPYLSLCLAHSRCLTYFWWLTKSRERPELECLWVQEGWGHWCLESTCLATGSAQATWTSEPRIAISSFLFPIRSQKFDFYVNSVFQNWQLIFFNVGELPVYSQGTHLTVLDLLARGQLLRLRRSAAKKCAQA